MVQGSDLTRRPQPLADGASQSNNDENGPGSSSTALFFWPMLGTTGCNLPVAAPKGELRTSSNRKGKVKKRREIQS